MIATSVLLAISSPLVRMRLRHALQTDPRFRIANVATDPAHAVEQIEAVQPELVVCDERMLQDPSVATLLQSRRAGAAHKVVLIAGNTRAYQREGGVPLVAVLPIDLPAEELSDRLYDAGVAKPKADPARQKPQRVTGMEHRFMIADDPQRAAQTTPLSTGNLGRPQVANRRTRSALSDQLAAVLRNVQSDNSGQQRDPITGLTNTRGLGLALRALPNVNQAAAVVVIDLWYATDALVPANVAQQHAFMRGVGALIRANVRQDDLVCRIDGMSFAVVLPGIDPATAAFPTHRLRGALRGLKLPGSRSNDGLLIAMGLGFWQPGLPAAAPLDEAWQAMLSQRRRQEPQQTNS